MKQLIQLKIATCRQGTLKWWSPFQIAVAHLFNYTRIKISRLCIGEGGGDCEQGEPIVSLTHGHAHRKQTMKSISQENPREVAASRKSAKGDNKLVYAKYRQKSLSHHHRNAADSSRYDTNNKALVTISSRRRYGTMVGQMKMLLKTMNLKTERPELHRLTTTTTTLGILITVRTNCKVI